jgi:hypothetical protein
MSQNRQRVTRTRGLAVAISLTVGLAGAAFISGVGQSGTPAPTRVEPVQRSALSAMSQFQRGSPSLAPSARAHVAAVAAGDTSNPGTVPEDFLPGRADLDKARMLMTGLGREQRSIFAFPTAKGRVCSELTNFSSGCLDGFRSRSPVAVTYGDPSATEPGIVWGLAPDDVNAVSVIVNGSAHPAQLGKNAYFYQGSSSASAFEALVITFKNGQTKTVPIHYERVPQLP